MTRSERFLKAVADIMSGHCPTCGSALVPQAGWSVADCPTCVGMAWGAEHEAQASGPMILQGVDSGLDHKRYLWFPDLRGKLYFNEWHGGHPVHHDESVSPTPDLVPFLFKD